MKGPSDRCQLSDWRADFGWPVPRALVVSARGIEPQAHSHSNDGLRDHDNRCQMAACCVFPWGQREKAPPRGLRPRGGGGENRHGRDDLKLRSSAPSGQAEPCDEPTVQVESTRRAPRGVFHH
jgi:hypothetical protein